MNFLLLFCVLSGTINYTHGRFDPTWDSLDTRKIPDWYDKAKVGIFLHWGVYSVPSFVSEWFWYYWSENHTDVVDFMKNNYPPNFTYQDFAKDFTAEFFNGSQWADLFARSGAKYVVLTSKHHEGYTLWPSKYSYSWNAKDVGPKRDLVGELASAIREKNLHFGLYHSLFEWFNPIYDEDRSRNFTTSTFVDNKIIPEMKELINTYKPDVLWSDGDGEAPDTYWKSTEFLAWLYNDSPVKDIVVTNDRWGNNGIACNHGDFYSCDDRYNPGVLQPHKWENAMTVDSKSWGYRRNATFFEIFQIQQLIGTLVETISCGGNILINVGPTKEGTIVPMFQERLLQLGTWLSINGEAIYESDPWTVQNDTTSKVWYTTKSPSVYAIALYWPENNIVTLGSAILLFADEDTVVTLLGYQDPLIWNIINDRVHISLPDKASVVSEWAWVLKITPKTADSLDY